MVGVSRRLRESPIGVGDSRQIEPVIGFTASRLGLPVRVLVLSLGRLSLAARCESSEAQSPPVSLHGPALLKGALSFNFALLDRVPDLDVPMDRARAGWPAGTWRGEQAPGDSKPFRLEICRSTEQHEQCDPCRSPFFFHGVAAGFKL